MACDSNVFKSHTFPFHALQRALFKGGGKGCICFENALCWEFKSPCSFTSSNYRKSSNQAQIRTHHYCRGKSMSLLIAYMDLRKMKFALWKKNLLLRLTIAKNSFQNCLMRKMRQIASHLSLCRSPVSGGQLRIPLEEFDAPILSTSPNKASQHDLGYVSR